MFNLLRKIFVFNASAPTKVKPPKKQKPSRVRHRSSNEAVTSSYVSGDSGNSGSSCSSSSFDGGGGFSGGDGGGACFAPQIK